MTFDNLVTINKKQTKEGFGIREENLQFVKIIEKYIDIAEASKEDIIKNAMKCAAVIKLYQVFYDGNHRTALIVYACLLKKHGIKFNLLDALKDMSEGKLNLPTIYDHEEEIEEDPELHRYLVKNK